LEIACAGGHNCLLKGLPGAGKTLLARALPLILPRLTLSESLDITRIYSVADALTDGQPWCGQDPSALRTTPSATLGWWAVDADPDRGRSAWRKGGALSR
jgi:predicted ATPase with chaperone activity